MSDVVKVSVNGLWIEVVPGTTVAAAMMTVGAPSRRSVGGQVRGPLCGMGICYECRAEVDGKRHIRSCQVVCEPGMQVKTDE